MAKNVLIVGMPRSGTSLTANLFVRQGYYVGKSELSNFESGDDHNPFGYFEADDVVERNINLFRRVGYRFQNTWRFEKLSIEAAAKIRELEPEPGDREFVERYFRSSPWVWKDQRLCFTLPYWWKLMDPAKVGVLLIRRDPKDIYNSFYRIGWCSRGSREEARIHELNEQHLGSAEAAIRDLSIPHIEVEYTEYMRTPELVAQRISEFFELDLTGADLNVKAELDHSRLSGRTSARLRVLLKRLPREPIRRIERLLPRWAVAAAFPERRYLRDPSPGARAITEALAREDVAGEPECEVARRLGVEPLAVAVAARLTWRQTLSAELRDRLGSSGDGERQALRDKTIEQLIGELRLTVTPAPQKPLQK
jgi:hypothetical protein